MTAEEQLRSMRLAWAEFDRREPLRKQGAKLDQLSASDRSRVQTDLRRLSGHFQRQGEALSQLVKTLERYQLSTVDIIAAWQLDTPKGLISFQLERTAPTLIALRNAELVVSWTRDSSGFKMEFELT